MIYKLIIRFITYNKLRSFLVILSIFISSLFFLSILGFGNAQKEQLISNLNRLSSNIMIIVPVVIDNPFLIQRAARTGLIIETFKESDLKSIYEIPGVLDVYKGAATFLKISTKKADFTLQVTGIEKKGVDILYDISELDKGKTDLNYGEILIGGALADRYELRAGDIIKINNRPFKIAGIFKKVGQNLFNLDNAIFMLVEDLIKVAGLDEKRVYSIIIKFDNSFDGKMIIESIHEILDKSRKINDPNKRNYSILAASSISQQIDVLIDGLKIFFLLIASISIVVSIINLINNLYIFVSEKYKQFATLKVIGADRNFITFLIFGMVALFVLLGLLPSFIIIAILSNYLEYKLYPSDILISIILLAISILISVYFPSRYANNIEPAEALRNE